MLKSICAFVGCRGVVHPLLNGHSSSNLVVCFFVLCSDVFEVDFLLFAVHLDWVIIYPFDVFPFQVLYCLDDLYFSSPCQT